jgi:hypothetical protein
MFKSMSRVYFIADLFADTIAGGGELNNEELINILTAKKHDIRKVRSIEATPSFLNQCPKNSKFIVSNFIALPEASKRVLEEEKTYVIYEHDHKYLASRNPATYKDFIAPKAQIVNFSFYKRAAAVLCQSEFHANIVHKNIELENIRSLGGNLWPLASLKLMEEIGSKPKDNKCAIMNSNNWHKNTRDAVRLCKIKEWEYSLINPCPYHEFLELLGKHGKFIFLPKTPETLSRVVVEARMMGMSVVSNNLVGASKEPWFSMKGAKLIDRVKRMREDIPKTVLDIFYGER